MAKPRGCISKLLMLVLVVGAAVAALPLVPLSPLKHAVEVKLSDSLGRSVTIDSVRLNLISGPYLSITGMTAREDPEFGDGIFLKAGEVRAGLDLIQYLKSRQIVINSITLKSPTIDLVKNHTGVWSWTTLGRPSEATKVSHILSTALFSLIQSAPTGGTLMTPAFGKVRIENASVKLRDFTGPAVQEALYKNIGLNASLTRQPGGDSGSANQATGELVVQSEEDGEADRLIATLPFDLKIGSAGITRLSVSGSIGPGPVETKNLRVGTFALNGEIDSNSEAPLSGNGQMAITDLAILTVNLSERVARALKLDQIGDMSPGTSIANLDTDFNVSQGSVNTTGLKIQQLDGLGDATVPTGSFKIESALALNYAATIVLSPEATARVKTVSPTVGLLVTIFETNNRISVPVNITGDVRNPEVHVDVSRIF